MQLMICGLIPHRLYQNPENKIAKVTDVPPISSRLREKYFCEINGGFQKPLVCSYYLELYLHHVI